MPDTWDGTTDGQLCTGNCIRNGGANNVFTVTTTIPAALDKKAFTIANLATYTSISTGSSPLSDYANNQCPSKGAILGTF